MASVRSVVAIFVGVLVSPAFSLLSAAGSQAHLKAGSIGDEHEKSLLQTWGQALESHRAKETPVARVVKLLKEIEATLKKEMDEDDALFCKLKKWCNGNDYEKTEAISAGEQKSAELESDIETLTAKSAELKAKIKELEDEVAADKAALAEATAIREKQAAEFHGSETDSVQAIENLKAAIEVLSKHHGAALPQLSSLSLLAVGRDEPMDALASSSPKFLQQDGWSASEVAAVQRAMKSASTFMQAHHESGYYPSYAAQSGEIMGVLQQLKEEMEASLSDSQKEEMQRAATFAELREAKTAEISEGEKMSEKKEDELADTDNKLAEAKEDLGQTNAALEEDRRFMMNLNKTCSEAESNFEARKEARLAEIKAVDETISILMKDDARDLFSSTYSFLQTSTHHSDNKQRRNMAAARLREAAKTLKSPELSVLATSVELDAFTRVKKAIDDMVSMLEKQQKDEVEKNDYCTAELHSNDMATEKTSSEKADLEAKESSLESDIPRLTEEIADAKTQIANLQLNLQSAGEDRKAQNLDFQRTVADQTATKHVLHMALERLAKYYDNAALVQSKRSQQTPPVAQMEYTPNDGATGVMSMLEKLIQEADGMISGSKREESNAQAGYETFVKDSFASIAGLQTEVATKTEEKAEASKEKIATSQDIADAAGELDRLDKYETDLHTECDYVMKNFDIRQGARAQEIEALKQAKQILSGANLS
mmetsp:Transcript_37300/g.87347  ORF Transcript_37300/g.87347 Transcript_37300/m.87347 type:complete len:714 (-) Transcript_37300:82-2223(-)